jgi:hypothetical protein
MPWEQSPSILEFVRAHAYADKPGLVDDGYSLPDEEQVIARSGLPWAPGAMDGVATHHMEAGDHDAAVGIVVERVLAYARQPTAANKLAVYEPLVAERVVSIIDQVIEALVDENDLDAERLYELAHSFVMKASDREPVKFGVAILGLFRQPGDAELFQALGRHDEFTLFCAVALANAPGDRDEALWMLARNVTGWGRIHTVERLAKTENPEIKRWLLREGYRNDVMYEYLAGTCARAGGLRAALSKDVVDRELLTAAGEIIAALISGRPGEEIDGYEDARPVITSYLHHMASSASTIQDFLHVNAVKGYLDQDDSDWEERYQPGWTAAHREALRPACDSILGRPEWADRVRAGLGSDDESTFFKADRAAKALGIDTWDIHWRRLQEMPAKSSRWYHIMALCDENRIGPVVAFAEAKIDLAAIATGAGDELGLGPGFKPHQCLEYVLPGLQRFPGKGAVLIEAGLKSPVVRNRNAAAAVLAAWPREAWPDGLQQALEQAAGCEPNEDAQETMQKVLRREPLS